MVKSDERRIITPLNSTFMLTSIIGFLISVFYLPSLGTKLAAHFESQIIAQNVLSYSIAFAIVFGGMFFASLISMTYAPYTDYLQIDEKRKIKL